MRIGLGIDTGGTYTDAALVDLESRRVIAKAKSPTTYQDLSLGVIGAIDGALSAGAVDPRSIGLVGLSTTLATNSILQGKGGEVGLIHIGWAPDKEWDLGFKMARFVAGGHDVQGMQLEQLDEPALAQAVDEMAKEVDVFVVSALGSVCNPIHEIIAKEKVRERTRLKAVPGHTLTGELGVKERTVTAVLNAKLLPIIDEFLAGVTRALKERGIEARVMVFKGDGTLMSIEDARERPVETILSGPAASLMGARAITGVDSCVVVDIGGTSTDIAFMDDGFPRLHPEGAVVGQWRTRAKAIDMWTAGLGGDSVACTDRNGELVIGPERVIPLAIASRMASNFKEKMSATSDVVFYFPARATGEALGGEERKVFDYVKAHAPCSLIELIDNLEGVYLFKDDIRSLKVKGYVLETGFTPTDALHITGEYLAGDVEASRLGGRMLADKEDVTVEAFAAQVLKRVVTRAGEEVLKKVILDETGSIPESGAFQRFLRATVGEDEFKGMKMRVKLDRPLIGVGAPAHLFIQPLQARMDAEILVPGDHDVGNAVGAVCSQVSETMTIRIYPKDAKFIVFAPSSAPMQYGHKESALESARCTAEEHVRTRVELAGAEDIRVRTEVNETRFCDGYGKEMQFINWIDVKVTATGRPKLKADRPDGASQS